MEHNNTTANRLYLGLKISKKLGNAVIRNKIRRRIKSIARSLHNYIEIEKIQNKSVVIVPNKGFESICYNDLLNDMISLLLRLLQA